MHTVELSDKHAMALVNILLDYRQLCLDEYETDNIEYETADLIISELIKQAVGL